MSTEILTITDLTRMSGNRVCIAGYTPDGACVRPELPYGFFTEPWLIQDSKGIVRPFAKVEFKLDRHIPDPPHTEDWVALPAKPRVCGHVPPADRMRFLHATASPDVESIFRSLNPSRVGTLGRRWRRSRLARNHQGTRLGHHPRGDAGWRLGVSPGLH